MGSLQSLDKLYREASTHAQAEVYFIQRRLAEMIVPDETLAVIYGLPNHNSDLTSQKPYLRIEEMMTGRVPFQQPKKTAEGPGSSAQTTEARTAAASNQEDQDMVHGDASDVGEQGSK